MQSFPDNCVFLVKPLQELHFGAKYWMYSGLPGAPTSAADVQKLEDQLYNYAIGIALRRIDWSYVTHSDIRGSNLVCKSPRLFAAYHVLRRLQEPRHPPYALTYFLLM